MDQGPGGGCQHVHKRQHDRREVYAHRQSDAGLDGPDRGVGEPFQIRDSAASTAMSLPILPMATLTSAVF